MQITLQLDRDFESTLNALFDTYGEAFMYINGLHSSQLDYSEFINKFIEKDTLADSSVDPNANSNHRDIRTFMTEKGKASDKLFGLNKIFATIKKQWGLRTAKEWLKQEWSKGFYLNDSHTSSFFGYCWANDLTRLATEGLFFLNKDVVDEQGNRTQIKTYNNQAPKHLTTYFDDVIEFISFLSNRQSGAVGLPNVLIWAYYFWKNDVANGYYLKDPETYLRQNFQKFIYRLNQPFIRIDQSAFTNVSIFDRFYLTELFGGLEFPDGTFAIDQIEELVEFQKIFMEVVSETRETNMFTFPVLTFSLYYKNGKFQDNEFAHWASNHNIKWSDSNFFVSDNIGVLSNCCRLLSSTDELDAFKDENKDNLSKIHKYLLNYYQNNRGDATTYTEFKDRLLSDKTLFDEVAKQVEDDKIVKDVDIRELINIECTPSELKGNEFINSIGGTALSVGSVRVSTINLARIAYEVLNNKEVTDKNIDKLIESYLKLLKERTELNIKALASMRYIIQRNIEKGLLPNYMDGAVELEKQFCTIGILGLYEVMDLYGLITTDEIGNKSYSDKAIEFGSQILTLINDAKDSFDVDFKMNIESIPAENCAGVMATANNLLFEKDDYYILSNQWIPLKEKCNIQEKCRLGSIFDKQCGGGTIAHINIENRFPNKDMAWEMLNYVAKQGVIYFAFTTKISVDEDKHAFIGTNTCPQCGKPAVDTFSRVVGFYTPVSNYQSIRKREFDERQWYNALEKDTWF